MNAVAKFLNQIRLSGIYKYRESVILVSYPFHYYGLLLIPVWINNYIHCNVWDEITYPLEMDK